MDGIIIFTGFTYTFFWLPCVVLIAYFLLGSKHKQYYSLIVFLYLFPLWEAIPTHYKMTEFCSQKDRFLIYKKYNFKDAYLEENYLGNRGKYKDDVIYKNYKVVFDPDLKKPDISFKLGLTYENIGFSINKITYTLYNDKQEVVSYYIKYKTQTGIGDAEPFYNPFLFLRLIKTHNCESYNEEEKNEFDMIHDAILIQPTI